MITSRSPNALKFIERLRREHHRCVVLPPGLEGFDDVSLNAWVLQKHPGSSMKSFEYRRDLPVSNDGVGAVKDVEQESGLSSSGYWLMRGSQSTGSGKRRSYPRRCRREIQIVRLVSICEAADKTWPSVFASTQRAQHGIRWHKVFNLVIQIALGGGSRSPAFCPESRP